MNAQALGPSAPHNRPARDGLDFAFATSSSGPDQARYLVSTFPQRPSSGEESRRRATTAPCDGPPGSAATMFAAASAIPLLAYADLEGLPLSELLSAAVRYDEPIPFDQSVAILQQLSGRWTRASWVHGCIVPQLVLAGASGRMQLMGWELASSLVRSAEPEVRRTLGPYLSPRVLAGGGPRTGDDVYSLAVLLLELATGAPARPRPRGYSRTELQDVRLVDGEPLSPSWVELLRRSLAAGTDRVATVPEWSAELANCLRSTLRPASRASLSFLVERLSTLAREMHSGPEADSTAPEPTVPGSGVPGSMVPRPVAQRNGGASPAAPDARVVEEAQAVPTEAQEPAKSGEALQFERLKRVSNRWLQTAALLVLVVLAWNYLGRNYRVHTPEVAPIQSESENGRSPLTVPRTEQPEVARGRVVIERPAVELGERPLAARGTTAEGGESPSALGVAWPRMESQPQSQNSAETETGPRLYEDHVLRSEPSAPAERLEPVEATPRPSLLSRDRLTGPDQEAGQPTRPEPRAPRLPQLALPEVWVGQLVEEGGPGAIGPRPVRAPTARLPRDVRAKLRNVVVQVRVLVDESGSPLQAEVLAGEGLSSGIVERAMRACRKSVFSPPTKSGVRVKMWTTVPVRFNS